MSKKLIFLIWNQFICFWPKIDTKLPIGGLSLSLFPSPSSAFIWHRWKAPTALFLAHRRAASTFISQVYFKCNNVAGLKETTKCLKQRAKVTLFHSLSLWTRTFRSSTVPAVGGLHSQASAVCMHTGTLRFLPPASERVHLGYSENHDSSLELYESLLFLVLWLLVKQYFHSFTPLLSCSQKECYTLNSC